MPLDNSAILFYHNIVMEITVQPLARSRLLNQALRLLDETFVSPRVRSYPRYLGVTITGDCNIKCIYCERQKGSNVRDYYFPTELYEQMEPYFHTARRVTLLGLGEPFMHKDFEKMVRMAKTAGAECITTTNGTMLNDHARRMLVEIQLDYLGVSIDSPDSRTFEVLRAGAKYERVIENVRKLRDLKRERGSEFPRLGFAMTVSRENVAHIPNMVRLAHDLGCVDLHLQNIVLYRQEDRHQSVLGTRKMERMIRKGRELAAELGLGFFFVPRDPFTPEFAPSRKLSSPCKEGRACREAWTQFLVYDNGDVRPCCFTAEVMGNLKREPMEAVFNSEKFVDFRGRILSGRLPDACIDCGYLIERDPGKASERLERARAMLDQLDEPAERDLLVEALKETETALAKTEKLPVKEAIS